MVRQRMGLLDEDLRPLNICHEIRATRETEGENRAKRCGVRSVSGVARMRALQPGRATRYPARGQNRWFERWGDASPHNLMPLPFYEGEASPAGAGGGGDASPNN